MHGVAERVEDGGDVEVDVRLVPPDVCCGQRDLLGEGAWMVDPTRVRALNAPTGHAVAATAASRVALTAHEVAQTRLLHVGPDIHDLADELMADNKRHRHAGTLPVPEQLGPRLTRYGRTPKALSRRGNRCRTAAGARLSVFGRLPFALASDVDEQRSGGASVL